MIFKMKRIVYILSLLIVVIGYSCVQDEPVNPGFEDAIDFTAYDYMMEHQDEFSSFIQILQKGGIDKTLSAYNPEGLGYTVFLPNNAAVQNFIDNSDQFSSLDDILNNEQYAAAFSRYHVVNVAVKSNDFPFGAFNEPTLSGDYLTVSFVIETDTSYYKINNQAAVILPNIEASNGYVHVIETALNPITFTTYDWLAQQPGFSIFKQAVDLTGQKELLNLKIIPKENMQPITAFVEPDSIYRKSGINSVEDLANLVSPGNQNYTDASNPLHGFVGYHVIPGSYYLNNFEGKEASNYSTFSEVPVRINGTGIDITINKGKEVFDTLVYQGDTTIVDYIGFIYDESNIITQSGAIHIIDQVMKQKAPSRAIQTYEFYGEPLLDEYRNEVGSFLIDDPKALKSIKWSGADLFFVDLGDQESSAWSNDYLEMDGDFQITFETPKIVQGKYTAFLGAEQFNAQNALVEVYIDGKKVGGLIDLTTGGSSDYPFRKIKLGTIDFKKYSNHTVEIRPLIPGRFLWDYIRFEPY